MKYFQDNINTIKELNEIRVKIMSELNAEYNTMKNNILSNVRTYKRIPILNITSIEVAKIERMVSFALTGERSNKARVVFNADGTVQH